MGQEDARQLPLNGDEEEAHRVRRTKAAQGGRPPLVQAAQVHEQVQQHFSPYPDSSVEQSCRLLRLRACKGGAEINQVLK